MYYICYLGSGLEIQSNYFIYSKELEIPAVCSKMRKIAMSENLLQVNV